jgi:hypothetical protein
MARAVVRGTIGLLLAVAGALMATPLWAPAGATTCSVPAGSASQLSLFPTTSVGRPTTTVRPTTTTLPTTTLTTAAPTTAPTSTTRPPVTAVTIPATTAAPTTSTSTTVASIPTPGPAPATLPLASASQSGSIGSVFPILSGVGLAALIALLVAQWFLTRPGRQGPTL